MWFKKNFRMKNLLGYADLLFKRVNWLEDRDANRLAFELLMTLVNE
jgi:hypothetical protein